MMHRRCQPDKGTKTIADHCQFPTTDVHGCDEVGDPRRKVIDVRLSRIGGPKSRQVESYNPAAEGVGNMIKGGPIRQKRVKQQARLSRATVGIRESAVCSLDDSVYEIGHEG